MHKIPKKYYKELQLESRSRPVTGTGIYPHKFILGTMAFVLALSLLCGCAVNTADLRNTPPVSEEPIISISMQEDEAAAQNDEEIPQALAEIEEQIVKTANYMINAVPEPTVGSISGEWLVLGLAKSGYELPDEYLEKYYENAGKHVSDLKGILHDRQYTEYSRISLALAAIGKNPSDIYGYDILTPLTDYEKTVWQGVNGSAFALIALDAAGYKDDAIRDKYIENILGRQLDDGGFSMGINATADITAMVLQSLAKYRDREDVAKAVEKGLGCLAKMQDDGGLAEDGKTAFSENFSQAVLALAELEIAQEDERFVKNGRTLAERLMSFALEDGSFAHVIGGTSNQMATEQAFCAMVALRNSIVNQNKFFEIDIADKSTAANTCTISIDCKMAVNSGIRLRPEFEHLPENGMILPVTAVELTGKATVFEVLADTMKKNRIHMDYNGINSMEYVKGIDNLYEFDGGPLSGWVYSVNGETFSISCGQYIVTPGDVIEWKYTLDLGADLGNTWEEAS